MDDLQRIVDSRVHFHNHSHRAVYYVYVFWIVLY